LRDKPGTTPEPNKSHPALNHAAAGILADLFGLTVPIVAVGGITFLSGVVVVFAMRDRVR